MGINHRAGTGKKPSGARYTLNRGKRNFEKGRLPAATTIGTDNRLKTVRTKGNNKKVKVLRVSTINVYDPQSKTFLKATPKNVTENAANRHFVRQNVMTRGAIIDTDKGKARVTSRPGQDGTVNAILV